MTCQRCGKVTCTMRHGCDGTGRALVDRSDWSDGSRAGEASMLATILGPNATRADAADLAAALEAYHKGAERGELRALLVRLWGESPAIVPDLAGLAKRESQAERTLHMYETEPFPGGAVYIDTNGDATIDPKAGPRAGVLADFESYLTSSLTPVGTHAKRQA